MVNKCNVLNLKSHIERGHTVMSKLKEIQLEVLLVSPYDVPNYEEIRTLSKPFILNTKT
jgi:hypothetical protein